MAARPCMFRLSNYTDDQIQRLATELGMTRTTLVTLAVDRFYRQEIELKKTHIEPPTKPEGEV